MVDILRCRLIIIHVAVNGGHAAVIRGRRHTVGYGGHAALLLPCWSFVIVIVCRQRMANRDGYTHGLPLPRHITLSVVTLLLLLFEHGIARRHGRRRFRRYAVDMAISPQARER